MEIKFNNKKQLKTLEKYGWRKVTDDDGCLNVPDCYYKDNCGEILPYSSVWVDLKNKEVGSDFDESGKIISFEWLIKILHKEINDNLFLIETANQNKHE